MTLSFSEFRSNLIEIVAVAKTVASPTADAQTFSCDIFERKIYQRNRGVGIASSTLFWFKDSILMDESLSMAVISALRKTEHAFNFFLEKAFRSQSEYKEALSRNRRYDTSFLLDFSSTLKSLKRVFKGDDSLKVQALFAKIFFDDKFYPPKLQEVLKPFFRTERWVRFEAKTRQKIPFNLFRKLWILNETEKESLKLWLERSLIPHDKDWLTNKSVRDWADERLQELPKVLYCIWLETAFGKTKISFWAWMTQLETVIGDYCFNSDNYKFPSGPISDKIEAIKTKSLFSLHQELAAREADQSFIPLADILFADPYGRGIWREKLEDCDPMLWATTFIHKIFQYGAMPLDPVTETLKLSSFGLGMGGILKAKSRLLRVEINFTLIDDFIWEVAGKEFERYRQIYMQSNILTSPYGQVLKLISRNQISTGILDFKSLNKAAKREGLSKEYINRQVRPFFDNHISPTHHKEYENSKFIIFWDHCAWKYFPGLWRRHICFWEPVKVYKSLLKDKGKKS